MSNRFFSQVHEDRINRDANLNMRKSKSKHKKKLIYSNLREIFSQMIYLKFDLNTLETTDSIESKSN